MDDDGLPLAADFLDAKMSKAVLKQAQKQREEEGYDDEVRQLNHFTRTSE